MAQCSYRTGLQPEACVRHTVWSISKDSTETNRYGKSDQLLGNDGCAQELAKLLLESIQCRFRTSQGSLLACSRPFV
eukprot:40927-Amphidinium_carterae.1